VVRDQNGDPLAGIKVSFTVTQGNGTITGANRTTDANGEASTASWTLGPAAGLNVVIASIAGSGISGNPVTFTATGSLPAPSTIASASTTTQTAEAGAAVATPPSVIVKDANQQPFAGAVVVFAVTGGGGLVTGASQTTDANGRASADSWVLGLVPGNNTLTATVAGAGISGNPVTFTATGTAPGPASITPVSPVMQSALGGSPVAVPPSVVVLDDHREPVAGASVTFSVTAGGGQLTGANQTTNANGKATAQSWTLGSVTGDNEVEARLAGSGINGNPVIFHAAAVPPGDSSVAANSATTQSALEGTAVAATPSITVRDENGNRLADVPVTFAVTSGGGSVTGATQTTDATGIATASQWILGTTSGINTLTATANGSGFIGNPVTFVATGTVPASVVAISAVTQAGTVGTAVASPPSVIVKDANQTGLAGATVTFAVTAGGGSVTGGTATTDAFGVATVTHWVLGGSEGTNTLTATVSGTGIAGNPVTFDALGSGPAPASITAASATAQTGETGMPVADPPAVLVWDAQQRPVAGAVVVFAITSGGGTIAGASQTTDAGGKATLSEWTLGAVPGVNTLTATVAGSGVVDNPVTFTATGTATAPASIAANSPTSQSAMVGTPVAASPSVTVLDHNQHGLAGVTVTFTITGGGGTVSAPTQLTDANGQATSGAWVLGPAPGPNTLTASITGSGITGNPVTFSATGTAVPDTAVVRWATFWGGTDEDQVRDLATDAQGNVYAAGGTASNDFPTTLGAFDRTHDDSPNGTVKHYDVFVSKFDSTGKLIWSTLLGGPGYDRAYAIEVDAQGFVYIGGRAGVGFPVTAGAAQTVFRGGGVALYGEEDGFVCKLRPDGSALVFCTYFGTNDFNIVRDIDIDPQGNVYIASSAEADFPAGDTYFNGSYQPRRKAGLDCVVAKVNASGSSFAWATWIGGSGDDGTQPSVRVDGQGNVWYIGGVDSPNMPLVNPTQATIGGGVDDYLAKLSPDGRQLLFATYLGGSGQEGSETHNLAVNRSTGDIYVGSATSSTDLAVTANALQPGPGGGGRDGLIARYSNAGALLSLSYVGGPRVDRFEGILVGTNGDVYVSGIGLDVYGTVGPSGPLGGGEDAAGLILSPNLGQVLFGIQLGGTDSDNGRAVAPMPDGGFVVGGIASSSDFPVRHAAQAQYGGSTSDGWIGRFIPR
jgi:adhesin/invasin